MLEICHLSEFSNVLSLRVEIYLWPYYVVEEVLSPTIGISQAVGYGRVDLLY